MHKQPTNSASMTDGPTGDGLVDATIAVTLTYDPMHRQTVKAESVAATSRRFLYAGAQQIAEYNQLNGNLQNRYIFAPGFDEPLIRVVANGTLSYLHHDRIGSIIAITNAAGVVTNTYAYSP